MLKALKITVIGRVQGVGFRPFIFQLADRLKIKGTVQNNMDGVKIFAEGEATALSQLIEAITMRPPRLSRVDEIKSKEELIKGYTDFTIIPSEKSGKSTLVIPVDSALCQDCLEEMRDKKDFRYQYPFINCTQCGPRYTIIDELPYDRPYTAMKSFVMCEKCNYEYNDPTNRRHHAQPIACPECGPSIQLYSIAGAKIASNNLALFKLVELLQAGAIIAIKGLGGYHLACDAFNQSAILRMRDNKNRPKRPFAVMASSIAVAKEFCHISACEAVTLSSPEAPIVVLEQKNGSRLPINLAPGLQTLGVMLPYTPLHNLIFDNSSFKLLVMTSANPSGLPILYQDANAFSYLKGIADYILTTEREILHPLDDSVVQLIEDEVYFFRRSRGYVPDPITATKQVHNIVALGGQQKNTFAIGRNKQIFLGPHIGDMENEEIRAFFKNELAHLLQWLGTSKQLIAVDKHPNYMTSNLAKEFSNDVIYVQHHHAHLVACMEDNKITEQCLGIILDGTGYGDDGQIWGFEFLYGDALGYKRMAHLKYTPLPGGEKAIKEPWRNAVAMLLAAENGEQIAKQLFPNKSYEIDFIKKMIEQHMNTHLAGTCGRLFDAVSSILGICLHSTYDGEAAIILSEQLPKTITAHSHYSYRINNKSSRGFELEIDFLPVVLALANDRLNKISLEIIIQKFHNTIVAACVNTVELIYENDTKLNKNIVLSGGSFHNSFLLSEIKSRLNKKGFKVYTHKQVPCNDGGLALGQLIVAAAKQ